MNEMSNLDEVIENKDVKCLVCAKPLGNIENIPTNVKGGVEVEINGHFGSNHDGLRAAAVICDECLEGLHENFLKSFNVLME
tara:strand:- start:1161 stop:1406 length:246 start_codon:yes stop_codon:yes gene_type:complete